jgi:hypothetical protein
MGKETIPPAGTSSYQARVNECEVRGHGINVAGLICSKCGLTLEEIRGDDRAPAKKA